MELIEYPLASPVPTTAPHPRDVGKKLLEARQGYAATCGFVGGIFSSSITCPIGSLCAQNTAVDALFCCNEFEFPYCGVGPTSCVDSTDMAVSCTGICPFDINVVKCTFGFNTHCGLTKYHYSTLSQTVTGYGCNSVPGSATAYDYYTNNGQITYAAATPSLVNGLSASATPGLSTSNLGGGAGTQPSLGPGSGTGTGTGTGTGSGSGSGTSSSSSSSGLSTGAIAGIAVGAVIGVAIIAGLIVLLCVQRNRNRRRQGMQMVQNQNQNPTNPNPMVQTPASPPPMNHHTSMTSAVPSNTSSTPLTAANIAAMSQPSAPSEVSPNESASQIGVPYQSGSVLSQGSPPTYHSNTGSNAASQPQSGLGPLPGPNYPTGANAFPHANTPSVMSPGSAFGSMPPVHAPSVTSYRPGG